MRILLDTHIFLWASGVTHKLSKRMLDVLVDDRNERFLSAVSTWEIGIKYSKGSLILPKPPRVFVQEAIIEAGIEQLPITVNDTLLVGELPVHHKDPFDRLLIIQAKTQNLRILTDDRMFDRYEVDVIGL